MVIFNELKKDWPMGLFGCRLFFVVDFTGMIVGVYTVSALSVERCIEVIDTKKAFKKKHKKFLTVVICTVIWLFAFMFSLPLVFSFEPSISADGSSSCASSWTEQTVTAFFATKYLFIFIVPFIIILVSSIKLVSFLVKWKKKMIKSKTSKNKIPKARVKTRMIKGKS